MDFLFALTSFWAVAWTLLAVVLLSVFVESEFDTAALCWIVFFAAIMYLFNGGSLQSLREVDFLRLAIFAVAYVGAGVVWSLIRWRMYAREHMESEKRRWKDFGYDKTINFQEFLGDERCGIHPSYRWNPRRIRMWIALWPFSILSTIASKWIVDGLDALRRSLTSVYVSMSRGGSR